MRRTLSERRRWTTLVLGVPVGLASVLIGDTLPAETPPAARSHAALGLPTATREIHDDDADGSPDRTSYESTMEYDQAGNRTLLVEHRNRGRLWQRIVTRSTYGTASRLVHEVKETDTRVDGVLENVVERWLEYDEQGNLVEERTRQTSRFRTSAARIVRTYDHAGRVIREVSERDAEADGLVDNVLITTRTYDERGNIVEQVITNDYENDGVADHRSTGTWSYNHRGDPVEEIRSYDADNDGVPDDVYWTTRTYDSGGRIQEEARRIYGPDGVLSGEILTEFTHDRAGRLIEEYRLVVAGTSFSLRLTYTYDSRGNLIEIDFFFEDDADGTFYSARLVQQFDEQNRLVQDESTVTKGDQVLWVFNRTYSYDRWGNLLERTTEFDRAGDGRVDSISMSISEYGPR